MTEPLSTRPRFARQYSIDEIVSLDEPVHLTQRARVLGYIDGTELLPWLMEAIAASEHRTGRQHHYQHTRAR